MSDAPSPPPEAVSERVLRDTTRALFDLCRGQKVTLDEDTGDLVKEGEKKRLNLASLSGSRVAMAVARLYVVTEGEGGS